MPGSLKIAQDQKRPSRPALAPHPSVEEDIHLARIRCLWVELQAARKDPVKYEAIAARLRREADAFRRMPARPRLMH